jgi:hypothetical protein
MSRYDILHAKCIQMATLKFNRNGGQRVVDTIHEHDTPTIRKMLLGKAVK